MNDRKIDKSTIFLISILVAAIIIVVITTTILVKHYDNKNIKTELNHDVNNEILKVGKEKSTNLTFNPEKYVKTTYKNMTISKMKKYNELSNYLDQFMDYINGKDYKKAYNMVWNEYLEEKNYTLESFKELMSNKYKAEMTINIIDYIEVDEYYYCRTEVFPSNYGEEETGEYESKAYYWELTIINIYDGYRLALEKVDKKGPSDEIIIK